MVVVVASSPTLGLSLIEISDIYTYAFIWHTERTIHNVHDRDLLSVRLDAIDTVSAHLLQTIKGRPVACVECGRQ